MNKYTMKTLTSKKKEKGRKGYKNSYKLKREKREWLGETSSSRANE